MNTYQNQPSLAELPGDQRSEIGYAMELMKPLPKLSEVVDQSQELADFVATLPE